MKERMCKKNYVGLWIGIAAAVIVIFAGLALWMFHSMSLNIDILGPAEISLEHGKAYTDEGANARLSGSWFLKDGIEMELKTSGTVDVNKLGEYQISYSSKCLWHEATATRTVRIIDTTAPIINLITKEGSYTLPGEVYQDEGFTATDDYDGDLTNRVIRFATDDYVVYTVSDSSGNETKVQRPIHYEDPIPPEIVLTGSSELAIDAGGVYYEPGYSATDNCDGDLTDKVVVSGAVDVFNPGDYTLTYEVTDSFGNKSTIDRIVTVNPARYPGVAEPTGKVIYLTFDDGPGPYTGELLDVLNKYGVKATFFVVNTGYYDTLRRIVNEGHSIAAHTATHEYSEVYASEEAYFNDLETMRTIIREQTGVNTTLIRFPGGSSNTVSSITPGLMTRLTQAVTERGYQYFDWNVDSGDAGGTNSTQGVFYNVINGIGNNDYSIVLQHDIIGYSVNAVEDIIKWGLSNGFTFAALNPSCYGCHHGVNN